MPTLFQAPNMTHPQKDKWISFFIVFHRLIVVSVSFCRGLKKDKWDYPGNSHVVFCPNKQRYF